MKKILLKNLIFKNYLKTSLTSILLIEVALIVIYFYVNNRMIEKSMKFIVEELDKTTVSLIEKENKLFEHKLNELEKLVSIVQVEQKNFFEASQHYMPSKTALFTYSSNGVYYKKNNNGGSSVVVSAYTKVTSKIKEKLQDTEYFDALFRQIVDQDRSIIAAYFNSHDNINRHYPYIPRSHQAFPKDFKIENYNFYNQATLNNNPNRKPVWTDVYVDPSGQGWLLSVVVPIYNQNFLEGVSGLDITVNGFIENFLNIQLPYDGETFIINQQGRIIAMPSKIEDLLGVKEVHFYDYKNKQINGTILKSKKFDLKNHKEGTVRHLVNNIVNSNTLRAEVKLNGENYFFYSSSIEKMPWHIVSVIPKTKVLELAHELKNEYQYLGYLVIFFILLFYVLFFFFLFQKAKEFVYVLNVPIKRLVKFTKNMGTSNSITFLPRSHIKEFDDLFVNFNSMAKKLDDRTKKLIESEAQRFVNEELANTDPLTGAYNRRFLEDFSKQYIHIVKRESRTFSVILMDIDKFKEINDTHGHKVGDKVLMKLVNISMNLLRKNDFIVRLGGDEFAIVLPNTPLKNAYKVASKITLVLNEQKKNSKYHFTVSVGLAQFERITDQNIEDVLYRADNALYDAKSKGRNCIKF